MTNLGGTKQIGSRGIQSWGFLSDLLVPFESGEAVETELFLGLINFFCYLLREHFVFASAITNSFGGGLPSVIQLLFKEGLF